MEETQADPGVGKIPGGGHSNPLHYFCLENPMDRGAWQATVHRVVKSRTRLKPLSTHTHSELRGHMLSKVTKKYNFLKNCGKPFWKGMIHKTI